MADKDFKIKNGLDVGQSLTVAGKEIVSAAGEITGSYGGFDSDFSTSLLNSLSDVDTTGLITGNFLKYDGSEWIAGPETIYADTVGTVTNNDIDLSTGNIFEVTANNQTLSFSNSPTVLDFKLKLIGAGETNNYNIDIAEYDEVSFDISGQETSPDGLGFNTDGSRMYIIGSTGSNGSIFQYDLSTNFDISSAVYNNVVFGFHYQSRSPTGLAFSTFGTRMFIIGQSFNDITQYDLSTGFDISTAVYNNVFYGVGDEESIVEPSALAFNPDGTRLFVSGTHREKIYQYNLSTGFDLSTISYSGNNISTASIDDSPEGLDFNTDGTKMFMVGKSGDRVYEFDLSTGFNLSTSSYNSNFFSVSAQSSSPRGLHFSPNGIKMYIVGINTDTVYQYTVGIVNEQLTITYPASVKFPLGKPQPEAPGIGIVQTIDMYTTDSGVSYEIAAMPISAATVSDQSLVSGSTPNFGIANMTLNDSDLVVVDATNLQEFVNGVDHSLLKARGTGVTSTYVSTVAMGGTTFAQPEVFGEISSDEGYFDVHYTGATDVTVATLSAISTYVYVDKTGALQQQTTEPTRQDWSRKMFTMRISVNIVTETIMGFEYLNNPIGHYANSIRDIYSYLIAQGVPFKKDQIVTGRNGDLGFDVSAGSLLELGGTGNINNANVKTLDAVANASYSLASRTAFISIETNLQKFWDNAGTITALGSTTVVGHRLYRFSNGGFAMQYGQGNYANMTLAKAGVVAEEYVLNPQLTNATFFGWWFIQSTATNTGGTALTDFKEYTLGMQGGSSSDLSGALLKSNNLSDLTDAAAARTNLGIGSGGGSVDSSQIVAIATDTIDFDYVTSLGFGAANNLSYVTEVGFTDYEYVSTGGQTVFSGNDRNGISLSFDSDQYQVFMNGIRLDDSADYLADPINNTITLSSGIDSQNELTISVLKNREFTSSFSETIQDAIDSAAAAAFGSLSISASSPPLTNYNFTATDGQTSFSGLDDDSATLSYTANSVIVTLNGSTLEDGADYTATDGSAIVLSSGAAEDDEFNVIAFGGWGGYLTGEVTSSFNGSTSIANNIVDEANLKVSNTPTDGYILTAQSGNAGGLTWAEGGGGGGGGATGGGSDAIFYENGQNVTTDYTISNGKNAMSAGPITIDDGVTVTIGSGETWTVV